MGLMERYMTTWQGGGAYVSGTANFVDCIFEASEAVIVSAAFQTFQNHHTWAYWSADACHVCVRRM